MNAKTYKQCFFSGKKHLVPAQSYNIFIGTKKQLRICDSTKLCTYIDAKTTKRMPIKAYKYKQIQINPL